MTYSEFRVESVENNNFSGRFFFLLLSWLSQTPSAWLKPWRTCAAGKRWDGSESQDPDPITFASPGTPFPSPRLHRSEMKDPGDAMQSPESGPDVSGPESAATNTFPTRSRKRPPRPSPAGMAGAWAMDGPGQAAAARSAHVTSSSTAEMEPRGPEGSAGRSPRPRRRHAPFAPRPRPEDKRHQLGRAQGPYLCRRL